VSGAAIGSGAGDALRRLKKAFSVSNLPVFLEANVLSSLIVMIETMKVILKFG
jgi:hypothetical protein